MNKEAVCVFNVEICIATDVNGTCVQMEQYCDKFIETCLEWDYECSGTYMITCVVTFLKYKLILRNINPLQLIMNVWSLSIHVQKS